jgi:hypothetical protein
MMAMRVKMYPYHLVSQLKVHVRNRTRLYWSSDLLEGWTGLPRHLHTAGEFRVGVG